MASEDSSDGKLLFCPFCRECYEGESECPVHELKLVEFSDLPKQAHERALPGWDEPVPPWEPRFGRAPIALGALAVIVGFFLPVVVGTFEGQSIEWTGFDVASGPARNLWTVPFVGGMFVYLLVRRRTPLEMLGARLVAILLSFMPLASLLYSLWNVQRGAALSHGALVVDWGIGAWVIAGASVLLLVGGVRFGAMPAEDDAPHGAGPERARSTIDTSTEASSTEAKPEKKRRR